MLFSTLKPFAYRFCLGVSFQMTKRQTRARLPVASYDLSYGSQNNRLRNRFRASRTLRSLWRCVSLAFARRPVIVRRRGTLVHPVHSGLAGFQVVRPRVHCTAGADARRRLVFGRRGQHDGVRVRVTGVQQDRGQRGGDAQAGHGW